jgi:hypothetical protein
VSALIDSGIDIDIPVDSDMFTALETATAFNHVNVVRYLLKRGASQSQRNLFGLSPAMLCWNNGHPEGQASSLDIFKLLCDNDFQELNAANVDGRTVLHIASESADGPQIESLLRLGSNVRHLDICKYSPVNDATFYGNYSSYRALTSNTDEGVPESRNRDGWSSIHSTLAGKDELLNAVRKWTDGHQQSSQPFWLLGKTGSGKSTTFTRSISRKPEHDDILKDLLERGEHLHSQVQRIPRFNSYIEVGWNIPPTLRGREVTAHQLAAGYGPATESWFLGMLRKCSLLT